MSKRRFFIIGKGSGSVMRHLTVNVGGGHGSLLVNGELVTLNENNNYEGDFPDGTQIELETVASTDWQFEGWYDDSEVLFPGGWNFDNPTTFTLDADYSLELHFVELFDVVVQTSLDPSYGYITVNGVQGNFSDKVADGGELTLQAVPDNTTGDGRRVWFSYWYDGSYDYSNPTTYTVNNDVTIEAGFSVDHFTEFIVDSTKYSIVRGGQTMTQTFTDAFISGSCEQYECVCETGYQFDGWLVDGVLDQNTDNPRYFCDNGADRTVEPSVSAVAVQYNISIVSSDNNYGYVEVDGVAGDYTQTLNAGTQLSLRAVPNNITGDGREVEFSEWEGNNYDIDNPTTYTVSGDDSITANFHIEQYIQVTVDSSKYTIVKNGSQTMTQDFTDAVISGECNEYEVIPETGYQFDGWLIDGVLDGDTSNPRDFCDEGYDYTVEPSVSAATPTQPNDEIWYTSSNGQVVAPNSTDFGTGITVVSNTYADGKGIIKLSGNATNIGDNAFKNCTTITSIGIPETVTRIGYNAFEGCTGLTSVIISDNVMFLTQYAFYNCTGLTSVTIGKGITTISKYAFFMCSGLISITIPDNVTYIEDGVFCSCTGLTSITCEATTPPTLGGSSVFDNTNNCPIYVPSASVTTYQNKTRWSEYSSRIQAIQP